MVKAFGFDMNIKQGTISCNGLTFDMSFLSNCHLAYERLCSAQYIHELKPRMSYQDCFDAACEVRNLCDDYGYTESEAIDEVLYCQ